MDTELWLGSLSLYQEYIAKQQVALFSEGAYNTEQAAPPEHFSLFGNVGVLDISGTLTNDTSWWSSFMGNTSYDSIRQGLIEAATHSDVHAIVLNIDSGGGTPNGLTDVANMVQEIRRQGTPVCAYSGGIMASAAYWLGASADTVVCGETATVGSIGVISVHKEYTDMMKKDGIKATVFRAGEEKALGNPYEKLTEKAKENIQSSLDALYSVFVNRIAEYRNVPVAYVLDNMAGGKEFIGQQALDVGLVDAVSTIDDLITQLQTKIDKQFAGKETSMPRTTRTLTQAQRDVMMEGVSSDAVLNLETVAPEVPEAVEDPSDTLKAQENTSSEETSQTDASLLSYLRTELSAKTTEVMSLNAQVVELTKEATALKAVHEPMRKLVAASIARMQIGLNIPMMDLSDLPAEVLLSQHTKVSELFCKKFPVGGIAALQAEDTTEDTSPVDVTYQTRLNQNKI